MFEMRLLFIISIMLITGCVNEKNNPSKMASPNRAEAGVVNCLAKEDVELEVYHSMYVLESEAQAAYDFAIAENKTRDMILIFRDITKNSLDKGTIESGGSLGFIQYGQFAENFQHEVFHMPLKELSYPLRTEYGWHIAYVSKARSAYTKMPCLSWPLP